MCRSKAQGGRRCFGRSKAAATTAHQEGAESQAAQVAPVLGILQPGRVLSTVPLRTRLQQSYSPARFEAVDNPGDGPIGKPSGGLWASPLQPAASVQDGAEPISEWDLLYQYDDEDYRPPKGVEHDVQVRPDARVVVIDSWADYQAAVTRWGRDVPTWDFESGGATTNRGIDWAALAQDADALWLTPKGYNDAAKWSRLREDGMESMYGWDLPSLVVLRPDAATVTPRADRAPAERDAA